MASPFDQVPTGLRNPTILDQAPPAPETPYADATGGGELVRGFDSALTGMGASAKAVVGGALDAVGLRDMAADWYRGAHDSARRAEVAAPYTNHLRDVNSVSSGLNYAAGKVGEGAAMLPPSIGAAALAGPGAGFALRSALAAAPIVPIAGGQAVPEHITPEGTLDRPGSEVAAEAISRGLVEGAIGGIAPAMIAGRALSKPLSGSITKGLVQETAREGGVEAASGAASLAASNAIAGRSTTGEDLLDAAVGSAIGVAPFSAGASLVSHRPNLPTKNAPAPAATPPVVEPPPVTTKGKDAPEAWAENVSKGADPFPHSDSTDHGRAAKMFEDNLADPSLDSVDKVRARKTELNELAATYAEQMIADPDVPQAVKDRLAGITDGDYKSEWQSIGRYADILNDDAKGGDPNLLERGSNLAKEAYKKTTELLAKFRREKGGDEDGPKFSHMDTDGTAQLADYVYSHLRPEFQNEPGAIQAAARAARALAKAMGFDPKEAPAPREVNRAVGRMLDSLVGDKEAFVKGLPSEYKGVFDGTPDSVWAASQKADSVFAKRIDPSLTKGQRSEVARRLEDYLEGRIPDKFEKQAREAFAKAFGGEEGLRDVIEHYGNRYEKPEQKVTQKLGKADKKELNEREALGPEFHFSEPGTTRGFTSKQGAEEFAASLGKDRQNEVVSMREAAEQYGGAEKLAAAVRKDMEARAKEDERHSKEPGRAERAAGLRSILEATKNDSPEKFLDRYHVVKSAGKESGDLVASNADLNNMRQSVRKGTALAEGNFQVEYTNGKRVTLNAESVWKTMAGKSKDALATTREEEGDHAFRTRMFQEGVAAIMARSDVKAVHGADRPELLVDHKLKLRPNDKSTHEAIGKAINEGAKSFKDLEARLKSLGETLDDQYAGKEAWDKARSVLEKTKHHLERQLNAAEGQDPVRAGVLREALARVERFEERRAEDFRIANEGKGEKGAIDVNDIKTKEKARDYEDTGDRVGDIGRKGTPASLNENPRNTTEDMFGGRNEDVAGRKPVVQPSDARGETHATKTRDGKDVTINETERQAERARRHSGADKEKLDAAQRKAAEAGKRKSEKAPAEPHTVVDPLNDASPVRGEPLHKGAENTGKDRGDGTTPPAPKTDARAAVYTPEGALDADKLRLDKLARAVKSGEKMKGIVQRMQKSNDVKALRAAIDRLLTERDNATPAERRRIMRIVGVAQSRIMAVVAEKFSPTDAAFDKAPILDKMMEHGASTLKDVDPALYKAKVAEVAPALERFQKVVGSALSSELRDRMRALYEGALTKTYPAGVIAHKLEIILAELETEINVAHAFARVPADTLATAFHDLVDAFARPLTPLTDAQLAHVREVIKKQLGDKLKVAVAPLATDFASRAAMMAGAHYVLRGTEALAVGALVTSLIAKPGHAYESALITAHHEVMHAALARIYREYGENAVRVIVEAAQQEHIIKQVVEQAGGERAASHYMKNPEEMLVQAYGLWVNGRLDLKTSPKLEGFFNQIKEFVKAMLGMLRNDDVLAEVFASVQRGELADRGALSTDEVGVAREAAVARGSLNYSMEQPRAAREWTQAERDQAKQEAERILGPKIKVAFQKTMGWSGKWDADKDTITFSTLASDPSSVAWHEALHALMSKLTDESSRTKMRAALQRVADSGIVRKQLEKLLKDHPDALKQLDDPEERLAYMFQFHRAGLLRVGPETKNIFTKIADLIRKVMGVVSQWDRANGYMDAIYDGKFSDPSKAAQVIQDLKLETFGEKAKRLSGPVGRAAEKLLDAGPGRLRDTNVPALVQLANMWDQRPGDEKPGRMGVLQERAMQAGKWRNQMEKFLRGVNAAEGLEIVRKMREGDYSEPRAAHLKTMLDDLHTYMVEAGVRRTEREQDGSITEHPLGRLDDYFPQVWNRDEIMRDPTKAANDLMAAGVDPKTTEAIIAAVTKPKDHDSLTTTHIGLTPWNRSTRQRNITLTAKQQRAVERLLVNDPVELFSTYVDQATHRAEYARQFGNQGQKIDALLAKAAAEGATPEEITLANKVVASLDGTLGSNMDPELRKFTAGLIVYENMALLPLALLSSLVDPLGHAIRSQEWREAPRAMMTGLKGLFNDIRGKEGADREWARTLGLIDEANMLEKFGDLHQGMYMAKWLKKANDKYFQLNGMSSWNKSMRTAAMVTAERFMLKHATAPNESSERFLKELGIEPGDVRDLGDGRIAKSADQGLTPEQEERVQRAIFKFVDGAVIRPNAAHRPVWGSDPHYNFIFHLKQYAFSFEKTFSDRVKREAEYGNYVPMVALMSMVPVMDVVDTAQALLLGGGAVEAGGGLLRAISRSGVLGTKNFMLDAATDPSYGAAPGQSFLGPAVNHVIYAGETLAGKHSIEDLMFRSLPAGGLIKKAEK
jgi:hypothetical protein